LLYLHPTVADTTSPATDTAMINHEIADTKFVQNFTLAGSGTGFISFLVVGLVPALYFGGFAGLILAGGIFGTPVPQTLLAQGLVAFGMVLGVLAVGSLFLVSGAFAGAMAGWLGLSLRGVENKAPASE
jgi:hypothetical protein